jgi:hypothetical protein
MLTKEQVAQLFHEVAIEPYWDTGPGLDQLCEHEKELRARVEVLEAEMLKVILCPECGWQIDAEERKASK